MVTIHNRVIKFIYIIILKSPLLCKGQSRSYFNLTLVNWNYRFHDICKIIGPAKHFGILRELPSKGKSDDDFVALCQTTGSRHQEFEPWQSTVYLVFVNRGDVWRLGNTRDTNCRQCSVVPLIHCFVSSGHDRDIEWAESAALSRILEAIYRKLNFWREVETIAIGQIRGCCIEEGIFHLDFAATIGDDAADHIVSGTK